MLLEMIQQMKMMMVRMMNHNNFIFIHYKILFLSTG